MTEQNPILAPRAASAALTPATTPTLPHIVKSLLADSKFGEERWSAKSARKWLAERGPLEQLEPMAERHRASLQPARQQWLHQRITQMGLAFGHERNPAKVQAWLQETCRLLADLPEDILSTSIDAAIQRSERGFIPSVGEIRLIAEPLFADRKREASRLTAVLAIGKEPEKAKQSTEYATPEQVAAIKAEFGLSSDAENRAAVRANLGPPRNPTPADLQDIAAAMGVAPATGEGLPPAADIRGLTLSEIFEQRDRRAAGAITDEGWGGDVDDGRGDDAWRAVA